MNHKSFLVKPGSKVNLSDWDTHDKGGFKDKSDAKEKIAEDIEELQKLQDIFYASGTYSLLVIFQALDAAGKDGAIKHVMSGLNPQGCQVASFKTPSSLELAHDYLWRANLRLPQRGHIGIFNRSYYEEVLVVRVHPEVLGSQSLPPAKLKGDIWKRRFSEINNWEQYLSDNGTRIIKFFLHVSKEEQKDRFLDRINRPDKNWKLSPSDVAERQHWDKYQAAYEDTLANTSTKVAPWYVIPADYKWFSRALIADILVQTMRSFKLNYPTVDEEQKAAIEISHQTLLAEK